MDVCLCYWTFIFASFILVIVLVGWGVITWCRGDRGDVEAAHLPPPTSAPRDASLTPAEILKMRYARGEIDKEEYDRKLGELQG